MQGLARLGALTRERGIEPVGREEFHLLPENVPVLRLWGDMQTQWVHGMAGPTGFSWQSIREHPFVHRIPRRRRAGLLEGLAVMECAWISARARIAEAKRNQPC